MQKSILFPLNVVLILVIFSFAQDSLLFTPLANMTSHRYGMGYACDGSHIYAVSGGINISPWNSTTMERYDIANNTWSEFVSGLIKRRYASAKYISSQNKLYIFNGALTFTDTVEIVDVSSGAITYSVSNPFPVRYAGAAIWNEKIYIFGGSNSGGNSNRLYEFDPTTLSWTRLADMPEAKQTAGEIVNGMLYVFGGYNGSVVSTRIDRYDIQNDLWTFIGNMPDAISAHGIAVSGKYIWLVGCYTDLQSLALFNTETHEFTQINNNMTGRRHAGAIVVGDTLYVFGGNQTSSSTSALNSLECADISSYVVSIHGDLTKHPETFELYQNFPNPFNPRTVISWQLAVSSPVKLTIFNLAGQVINTLIDEKQPAGLHSIEWDATNLASGVYLYRLETEGLMENKKMILMK